MQIKDKNKMMVDTDLGRASLVLGADLEGTQEHVIDIWKSDTRRQGQLFIEVRSMTPVVVNFSFMRLCDSTFLA